MCATKVCYAVLQELSDTEQEVASQDPYIATTGAPDAVALRKAVLGIIPEHGIEIPFEELRYDEAGSDASSCIVAKLSTSYCDR